jgi:flagellar basal body P-ring formation protein FlgA
MPSYPKLGALGLVLLAALGAGAAETARIVVASDVQVGGDVVRLRDVASLEGVGAEALGDVSLGRAAGAGESRTFDGGYVLGALRRAGLDASTITYSIPPLVRVRRTGQTLDAAALRPVVERWLETSLGAGARDAELRELVLTSPVTVPVGGWEGRVVSAPRDGVAGAVRLQIEISAGAQPPRAVWVTADIARWVPVVVARRALARGEILSAADVEIDRRDLAALPRDVATDLSDVVGSAVRQSIVPFAPLRRDQLATVAVVRRGDAVQIIAQSGGLRITAAGEVRHDARRGEQVRVLNRASQREVLARVRDGSTVEVAF